MTINLSSNNVAQYLIRLKLCAEQDIDSVKIICQPSISSILLIVFSPHCQLFVQQNPKLLLGNNKNYINNELSINKFLNSCKSLTYTAALSYEIVHFDAINSILIYKVPNGHTSIENYYRKKNCFSVEISKILGTTLAKFHQETLNSQSCKDYFNKINTDRYYYKFPHPEDILEKPTPESINRDLPPEGLKFLGLYQSSKNLSTAVTKLVANHKHYCLTLNNHKFTNILIPIDSKLELDALQESSPIIKFVNWNHCSWGDPAFDLGAIISSYFLIWLRSIPIYSTSDLDQSLKLASTPFNVIQPLINSCVCSYVNEFSIILKDYPDFVNRAIQFAGLALVYSLLSDIQSFRNFNFQHVYVLQIAKNLICEPQIFVKSLFRETDFKLAL